METYKLCVNCGKQFKPNYKAQKFCCRACSGKYSGNKARKFTKKSKQKISDSLKIKFLGELGLISDHTDKQFIAQALNNYEQVLKSAGYISSSSGLKKRKQHTCKVCGKTFYSARPTTKCCSKECLCIANSSAGKKGGRISATVQGKRSKNEIMMADLCTAQFSNVKVNLPLFNGWDADIILEDYKVAILWNGPWHYKQISKSQSLLQVQTRDKIKQREIYNCGYVPYIIKDTGKYNPKFVKLQFDKLLDFLNNGLVAQR